MRIHTLFIAFVIISNSILAQDDPKDKAFKLGQEAIELMDAGKVEESIELLKEAQVLDPENYNYPYEIGLANFRLGNYAEALKVYKKVIKYDNITDQCYQMLGNAYDLNGKRKQAIQVYKDGLEKFPKAGNLYYELGIVQETLGESMYYFEEGINVDPTYATNYYIASKVFLLHSDNELWGMMYGEVLRNLEPDSDRSKEIAKMMYDTYVSEITIDGDDRKVSFASNQINISDPANFKLPYGLMVYEPTLAIAAASVDTINLQAINQIRTTFIEQYKENEMAAEYENIIFDWHQNLIDNGYFECYNYWLLSQGNIEEFQNWYLDNTDKFKEFLTWFFNNPMQIDDDHKFVRYDR